MAVMNTRPTGPMAAMQAGQQTTNVGMATGVAMKPGVSATNLPSPHQPGIGLKPGTQTPPAHVLQVVKQVQEEAARQQVPHVNYGKVAPTSAVGVGVGVGGQAGGVMPPPPMQRPMPVQMANPGGTHLIPMDQWTARYVEMCFVKQLRVLDVLSLFLSLEDQLLLIQGRFLYIFGDGCRRRHRHCAGIII